MGGPARRIRFHEHRREETGKMSTFVQRNHVKGCGEINLGAAAAQHDVHYRYGRRWVCARRARRARRASPPLCTEESVYDKSAHRDPTLRHEKEGSTKEVNLGVPPPRPWACPG